MKNKIILPLFIFSLLSANLLAQNFWVPDSVFRNKLKLLHPTCFTPQDSMIISCVSNLNINLNVNNENISSLEGVQYFTSLNWLQCSNLNLAYLPPLPNSLTFLECYNSHLDSLPALPASLLALHCSNNNLTSLPTLPNTLTHLYCNGNTGLILSSLPNSLTFLDCGGTHGPLPSLPLNLTDLYCYSSNLTVLPPLPNALDILVCSDNNLVSLPTLPSSLTNFSCGMNHLTTLPVLPNVLRSLSCYNNNLNDLPALPTALRSLLCKNNNLTTLPSIPSLLNSINCSDNRLTHLPFLPSSLKDIWCASNNLTYLPVLPNTCKIFDCSNNNITELPALPASLIELNCAQNPISCIFKLPVGLDTLNITNTYITCLPNIPAGILSSNTLPLCVFNSHSCFYANTYGFVFIDTNSNGIRDLFEDGMKLPIRYESNYAVLPDSGGFFYAPSDTGNITFEIDIPQYYIATTASSQTIHTSASSIDTLYFGVRPLQNVKDLRIDLTTFNAIRPGFNAKWNINYHNGGTSSVSNFSIKYLKPSQLISISSNPPSTAISGDTLIWNITSLSPYEDGTITVLDSISALATLGAAANADVWIEPLAGDTTPQDNYRRCHQIIRGSCDPNDKSATPEFISPAQNDYLEYVIRFQNTGTDTAFSVLVTDTLSMDLDVASIQLISSSHTCNFWVEHGIPKWYFVNILLPDSNVNEAASHGFVKFKILPKSNLTIGTQINNSANIYFDYNAAVITNTIVVNVTPLSTKTVSDDFKLAVFPNPVHQTVHLVTNNNKPLGKVELVNAAGKIIETKNISTSSFDWQVESLPDGVYLFKGENWQEKIVKR